MQFDPESSDQTNTLCLTLCNYKIIILTPPTFGIYKKNIPPDF